MGYFADLLSADPQPWLVDYIEMTKYPPTLAVVKNADDTTAYKSIGQAFYNSILERFSDVPIRGFVPVPSLDYQHIFQKMEMRINQNLKRKSKIDGNPVLSTRSVVQQSIENHSEWIGGYRALWSALSHRCDYTDFLTKCFSDDSELQYLCRRVRFSKYPKGTPSYQKLTPERFIQCMLEDELRKKNILITCQKMEKLMLEAFTP